MKHVDLSLLRTLIAVEETKSFERAAERVLRTQAAVSQQMTRLETQFGVEIFERVGRRNELTAAGRRLVDYARRMLTLNDEMLRAVAQSEPSPPVRIGMSGDAVDSLLPRILKEVARKHPEIMTDMMPGGGTRTITALKDGSIDLVISIHTDEALPKVPLQTLEVVWIAPEDFERPAPDAVIPLVLTREPSIFRRMAIEALARRSRPWKEKHQSPTLTAVRAAVAAGMGVTARTRSMLTPGLKVLDDSYGLPPLGELTYYLSIAPDTRNKAARKFFNCIRRMVAQSPGMSPFD